MPARLRCLTACGACGLANTTMGLSVRAKLSRNGAPTISGAVIADDPRNAPLADEYGIVLGTSHHEPMMRARDEWSRLGGGEWDDIASMTTSPRRTS